VRLHGESGRGLNIIAPANAIFHCMFKKLSECYVKCQVNSVLFKLYQSVISVISQHLTKVSTL